MNIKDLMRECYRLAKDSPDTSNQNGAILFLDGSHVVATGRNEFPPGIEVTPELLADRDKKLFYIEHAERNAIYAAARQGMALEQLIMICPWFACSDCARAIALSGIKRVIGHQERMDLTPERWKASVAAGLELLRNAGVQLEFYQGKIGECDPIIVNGVAWNP